MQRAWTHMTAPYLERLTRQSFLLVALIASGVLISWAVGWGHLALPGRPSRMMAVSTASLLGSLALISLARLSLPAHHIVRWLERATGLVVMGVAAWTMAIAGTADFSDITISFMTPYAAVVFLVAGGGALAHSSAKSSTTTHHFIGTAGVLIAFGGLSVFFGHIAGVLNVFGQPLPAFSTSLAFTALGVGVIGLGGTQSWPLVAITAPTNMGTTTQSRIDRVAAVAVVLGFGLLASVQIRDVYQQRLADQFDELAMVADERAAAVSQWHHERGADALAFFQAPMIEDELARAMTSGPDHPARELVRNWLETLRHAYGYAGLILASPDGRRIESAPAQTDRLFTPDLAEVIGRVSGSGTIEVLDKSLTAPNDPPLIIWVVPTSSRAGSPLLVLVADADAMLQSTLTQWSRSRRSTEVVVVTTKGELAGFLMTPRLTPSGGRPTFAYRDGSPMPGARAARGEFGPTDGPDYRGVRVLAVSTPAAGTPWTVVAKIDRAEAVAPAREMAWLTTVAAAMLAAVVLLMGGVLRSRVAAGSERQLQTLSAAVSQNPASIVITDLDGAIQYVNPAFLETTGYSYDEVIGQNPRILKSGKTAPEEYELMWKTLTAGQVWQGELQNKHKNGDLLWEFATISPLRDSQGRPYGYVGIKKDISGEKRAAAERQTLQTQLAQSQKMESIGRLAGGVAHDFNNMLAVILGHAEMGMEDTGNPDRTREHLTEILDATNRSTALTRQLLAFARKQVASPRVLDLNQEVEDTLKMLRRLIGENITLVWTPAPDVWRIRIDPSQVSQILANLSVNARDAISGAGTLTIATTNVTISQAEARANLRLRPGEFVRLTVTDTGSGMPPEVMAHLFEPFFTTKAPGKGTGLGTATVYGIVTQNNGLIDVTSQVGHGTTMAIYLPRVTEEVETEVAAQSGVGRGSGTILLVEDEASMRNMTRRMLERLGYTVIACHSSANALDTASTAGPIPLLLTDVVMPGMNGRELADVLTARHPAMKVVFMSGYTAEIIAPQGVLDDDVHFLPKPFTLAQLGAKLHEALESRP